MALLVREREGERKEVLLERVRGGKGERDR